MWKYENILGKTHVDIAIFKYVHRINVEWFITRLDRLQLFKRFIKRMCEILFWFLYESVLIKERKSANYAVLKVNGVR